MRTLIILQFCLAAAAAMLITVPAEAQPLLQWTFDEADSGSQDAIDSGQAPAENGIFQGGATRTSNTPGGATLGAADLFVGAAGTDAYIQATDADSIEGLPALTISAWINLQADPVGNDRIVSLQNDSTPPDGDFDENIVVDGDDLTIWKEFYGVNDGTADNSVGDANGDGNVLGDDFAIWQRQNGGPPGPPRGDFAGFSFNLNAPNSGGGLSANDFRVALFIGGLDDVGEPVFDFAFSDADVQGLGGQWIFLAATFDGATGALTYYSGSENGSLAQLGSSFTIAPVEIETTDVNFYAGKTDGATTANTSLEGFIDDVRIYNSALDLAALDAVRLENLAANGASAVPEPTALALASLGLALLGALGRRQPCRET